ncbi:hypothetical protein [Sphingomonas sp. PR090111-T3T-6A]|nr:hypothetical protein [Sphingomonas sp. PR090111-T3T-6A]
MGAYMGEAEDCAVHETVVSDDAVLALFVFASVTLFLLMGFSLFTI